MANRVQESLFTKYMRILIVVSCYWFVSISLVFVNKYLLSSDHFKINAPLFVTCFQCFVTVVLCTILSFLSSIIPSLISFPSIKINVNVLRSVLPLSLIFVAMITFNNLCLKFVGVPFYYIGRSLTTVFNVILTFTVLHQTVSFKSIMCCILIIFGFALGVNEEGTAGSLSIKGVLYGVSASFFVSLYSIYMKKILPVVEGSIWTLTLYNNINAVFLFIPLMIIFGEMSSILDLELWTDSYFWTLMSIGGTFGFAIGYVTGLQIKVTSPLTHNISGTAKACAQTVVAVMWFNEAKSTLWWASNSIVLLGSAAYTRVRQLEMMAEHQKLKQRKDIESNVSEKFSTKE
ncbi:GDP-fucose transporter 1 [Trichonephila clavata]|uniref:GDP-fucose transporter 1 n=1 Tax=Trichonephila clavata TaxID=2740835 RepID=A0A8X6G780_TRICU|nr:GDP-fucose transporter 1 [Trichonephila clavata]